MIDKETLTRCLDYLAEINAELTNTALKHMILDVGYVLKQELDNVTAWDKQFSNVKKIKDHNIDVKKLIEDNTQLFNENKTLHDLNLKLKEIIDKKIPKIEQNVENVNQHIKTFTEILSKA